MPTPKTRSSIAAIALFGLIAWLPFVNRPLSVDDHGLYQEAIYLSRDLSQPYQKSDGARGAVRDAVPSETNPPLYLYAQAFVMRLFGQAEWKAHLLQLTFNFIGVFAFFFLARRFTAYPLWATLIWIYTPHFLLTANTLMVDGCLISVMLLGLYAWIRGWDEKRPALLTFAAVVLGLAPLIKYTGILAFGLVVGRTAWTRPTWRDVRWLFLLVPLAMFAGWTALSTRLYGSAHVLQVAAGSIVRPSALAGLTILEFFSGTTWIVLVATLVLAARRPIVMAAWIVGIPIFTGILVFFRLPIEVAAQFGFWVATSAVWFVMAVALARRSLVDAKLLGWVVLGLGGLCVGRGWFCARYLVIVGPAIILLAINMLAAQAPVLTESRLFRNAVLALMAVGGLCLQQADFRRAVVDRDMARTLDGWLAAQHGARRAYYPAAGLSGLGYYLDQSSLWKPAAPAFHLAVGDVCVVPVRTLPVRFMPQISKPSVLEKIEVHSRNPFRTFDLQSAAGFYGSIWAPLPFSLSREPVEVYYILQEAGRHEDVSG